MKRWSWPTRIRCSLLELGRAGDVVGPDAPLARAVEQVVHERSSGQRHAGDVVTTISEHIVNHAIRVEDVDQDQRIFVLSGTGEVDVAVVRQVMGSRGRLFSRLSKGDRRLAAVGRTGRRLSRTRGPRIVRDRHLASGPVNVEVRLGSSWRPLP